MLPNSEKSFSCISDSKIQLSYLFFASQKRPCYCESSWNDVVCKNKEKYRNMNKSISQSLCICQKFSTSDNKCLQFMIRCVAKHNTSKRESFKKKYMISTYKYKISIDKKKESECSCCFNQPDEYCNHLSCRKMVPFFDREKQTFCECFSTLNFPYFICNSKSDNEHEIKRIINSSSVLDLEIIKKDKPNKDRQNETEYIKIPSEFKKTNDQLPKRMNFLTNRVILNVLGCIMVIFIVGTIACFITKNSKNSSQRSHDQIIDPNTEFLMNQRTNV